MSQESQESKRSRDDDAASDLVHKQPVHEAAQKQVPSVEGKGPMHKQRRGHLVQRGSEARGGTNMSQDDEPRARPRTRLQRRKVLTAHFMSSHLAWLAGTPPQRTPAAHTTPHNLRPPSREQATPFRQLAVEDKQRVARLISELTSVAAQRDEALRRLQEEEARFSQHLTALTSRIVVNESAQAGWLSREYFLF